MQVLPAPGVEFGGMRAAPGAQDVDLAFVAGEAQQEPLLDLSAITAAPAPERAFRQVVAQPFRRFVEERRRHNAGLLAQLAQGGLARLFAGVEAALRHLPFEARHAFAAFAGLAPAEEYFAFGVRERDADARPGRAALFAAPLDRLTRHGFALRGGFRRRGVHQRGSRNERDAAPFEVAGEAGDGVEIVGQGGRHRDRRAVGARLRFDAQQRGVERAVGMRGVEVDVGAGVRQVHRRRDLAHEAAGGGSVVKESEAAIGDVLEHGGQRLRIAGELAAEIIDDADIADKSPHQPVQALDIVGLGAGLQQGVRTRILPDAKPFHRRLQPDFVAVFAGARGELLKVRRHRAPAPT